MQYQAQFQAVHLLAMMSKQLPDWLPARPAVYQALLARWRSPHRWAADTSGQAASSPRVRCCDLALAPSMPVPAVYSSVPCC